MNENNDVKALTEAYMSIREASNPNFKIITLKDKFESVTVQSGQSLEQIVYQQADLMNITGVITDTNLAGKVGCIGAGTDDIHLIIIPMTSPIFNKLMIGSSQEHRMAETAELAYRLQEELE